MAVLGIINLSLATCIIKLLQFFLAMTVLLISIHHWNTNLKEHRSGETPNKELNNLLLCSIQSPSLQIYAFIYADLFFSAVILTLP